MLKKEAKSIYKELPMELHLISYPQFFNNEAQLVQSLMSENDFVFHLRKPNADDRQFVDFLRAVTAKFHHRFILHGAYGLVDKYNVMGWHFSEKNRVHYNKLKWKYSSTSCHSINEMEKLDGQYSQMFISPVFPSISKPGYSADFTLEEMRCCLSGAHKSKIIALGGVDKRTIPQIIDIGFDGCAVHGAVWGENVYDTELIKNNLKTIVQCIQPFHIV